MKNRRFLRRSHLLIFSIAVGSLLVIVAGSQAVGVKNNQIERPRNNHIEQSRKSASSEVVSRITTDLPKLEIVKVDVLTDTTVEVTVKNGYEKAITAMSTSTGIRSYFRRDYTFSGAPDYQGFAPGTTDQFLYTIPSSPDDRITT